MAFLAAAAGAAIGAVVSVPALASSGLGTVLANFGVNIGTKILDPVMTKILNSSDETSRGDAIQKGLVDGNPAVQTLVAVTLAHSAQHLASTFNDEMRDSEREGVLAAMEEAMVGAGGPLTAIASDLVQALRDRATDWTVLGIKFTRRLESDPIVRQLVDAGPEGIVESADQSAADVGGAVHQTIRGKRITGVSQTVKGTKRKP